MVVNLVDDWEAARSRLEEYEKMMGDLINKLLRDVGGAKSEYQELIRELQTLHNVLQHLDKLRSKSFSSTNVDSIKYAALSYRRPLEDFLAKVRKYESSLGVRGKDGIWKTATDKLSWSFLRKDNIQKFQNYLNIHVWIINILLLENGLDLLDLASVKASSDCLHIQKKLEETWDVICGIKTGVTTQAQMAWNTYSMLIQLFKIVNGEIRTSWKSLSEKVVQVW
ncbi:MAG: hypothetical protein MMC33_009929 [Icmadophila ericetorum]|nr:hypothetical protein [Icmadophila ericetorum]